MMRKNLLLVTACFFVFALVKGQSPSVVREYKKVFPTYPFSDPDPIPSATAIYPYFRYDGFTNTAVNKEWKVVELENDFIKVMILPEVGGKIWTAIEKSTGEPYLYYNHTVKFRDVAMRGPWTSGGLEPNYGIIGHTPNCATPVDYMVRTNADKSVSCIIGVLDLLTRTHWQIEINLPHDKAFFTTNSFWYNSTSIEQPYYHWMNAGIKTKGNLEFIYPGTNYIGHDGEHLDWPVNKENGKKINFYEENNFGMYKSYHVFGKNTDFFGAYYHDDQFGMVRYAPYEDKIGKKIWIWGLSRQGMIWDKILTDTDGQYSEIQSGRLFNQNSLGSTMTPFKHLSFAPHGTDIWKEYWYPVLKTRGFVNANNYGAINVKKEDGWIKILLSPVQYFTDKIVLKAGGKVIYEKSIKAVPLQLFADSVKAADGELLLTMPLSGLRWTTDITDGNLARPVESPADYNWNSAYGNYVMGKELMDQKLFAEAEEKLRTSLKIDPNYLPAMVKLSEWLLRSAQYQEAFQWAKKAISIDTHDGSANYYYGLSALRMGDVTNAKDGFQVSSVSIEHRSASYTELAKIYMRENNWTKAIEYADKAIDFNRFNVEAYEIKAVGYRYLSDKEGKDNALQQLVAMYPLSAFVKTEKWFAVSGSQAPQNVFQNELPEENWMEVAAGYYEKGLHSETKKILELIPQNPLASYWMAYINHLQGNEAKTWLDKAESQSPAFVFPFRSEMKEPLEWAVANTRGWKARYFLALFYKEKNQLTKAKELFNQLGEQPDYPPFYATRAQWEKDMPSLVEKDLQKAISLDKEQWRYTKQLADFYIGLKSYDKALAIAEPFFKSHPSQFIMGMLYTKTLLLNKRYKECDALLAKMDIIPFEGATDGRGLYWEAKLMQAIQQMKAKQYKKAFSFVDAATLWPENLGVGKPYDADIDSRVENWMKYLCFLKMNSIKDAKMALNQILNFKPGIYNTIRNFQPANHLITAWAMEANGQREEAIKWLDKQQQLFPAMKQIAWAKEAFISKSAPANSEEELTTRVLVELMK